MTGADARRQSQVSAIAGAQLLSSLAAAWNATRSRLTAGRGSGPALGDLAGELGEARRTSARTQRTPYDLYWAMSSSVTHVLRWRPDVCVVGGALAEPTAAVAAQAIVGRLHVVGALHR